jgi:hypothetical protein
MVEGALVDGMQPIKYGRGQNMYSWLGESTLRLREEGRD